MIAIFVRKLKMKQCINNRTSNPCNQIVMDN